MPMSKGSHSLCFQTFNFLPNVWWVCVLMCHVFKGHVSFCFWIVCLCPLSVFLWGTWSFAYFFFFFFLAYLFLKALYILESLALCNEWQIFFPHVVPLAFTLIVFFFFFFRAVPCGMWALHSLTRVRTYVVFISRNIFFNLSLGWGFSWSSGAP